MKIIAGSQTLWKQCKFPLNKKGSQILMYSFKILHIRGFICTMPELHNFVILGLADTFHERVKMNT